MKISNSLFLVCFVLTVIFSSPTLNSQTTSAKPVIVIVHGAWGGAWAFKRTDSILTEKGYNVYRPTLTGLGEKFHLANKEIGLETHINDVVNMIEFEDLHNIILIGHSYGGMVVTGVADKIPNRISKLIYLDAFLPEDGESVESLSSGFMDWVKPNMKDGFIKPFWVRPEQLPPHDVPHPVKTLTDKLDLKNPDREKISKAYLITVDPGKKPEQDDFAKYFNRAVKKGIPTYQMQADHNPQNSMPDKLAEMIMKIVNQN